MTFSPIEPTEPQPAEPQPTEPQPDAAARPRSRRGPLRLAGFGHPFAWGASAPILDSAELARQLAEPLGIAAIRPRGPLHGSAHQLSLGWIGPHRVAAWVGTAIEIEATLQAPPTLYCLRGGWLEWVEESRSQPLQPGWLFYGGDAYRLRSGVCSLVAIALDAARLEEQLLRLSGSRGAGQEVGPLLQRPRLLGAEAGNRRLGGLVAAMGSLLTLYGQLAGVEPALVGALELGRLIERLLAALLLVASGGIGALDLGDSGAAGHSQDTAFDALLYRLRTHLHGPLNLRALEDLSQRSRRELQMVFRERLGCTPVQWLRRERLMQARRRLEHPGPGDTVAAIARASGYASASRFSGDFRRMFGSAPSQVLKQRKAPPADGGAAQRQGSMHRGAAASGRSGRR